MSKKKENFNVTQGMTLLLLKKLSLEKDGTIKVLFFPINFSIKFKIVFDIF